MTQYIEKVNNLSCLGQKISEDGSSEEEVKRKIGTGKTTFTK